MSHLVAEPVIAGMGIAADSSAVSAPPASTQPAAGGSRFVSHPVWNDSARNFESAETTRLNQAHWRYASDESVNRWLSEQLSTIRSRAALEARNNGMLLGIINTHADDIVGPEGPTLQVISDDDAYSTALEETWVDWFAAPTPRPNVSGVAMLKLWVRSLWKCGEYVAQMVTVPNAGGPLNLRLQPIPPRNLRTPMDMTGQTDIFMGVRYDAFDRPATFYVHKQAMYGAYSAGTGQYEPVPADLMIHEFLLEEEEQKRGIPWANPALAPAADLRDYDNQVQDAARCVADQMGMLYTEAEDAPVWTAPEETTWERRTWKMAPPRWKPFVHPATQPPVQYGDYRAERSREFSRPVGMPLLMARLDSSKHNYSSARLDTQTYGRAVAGIQYWISGTPRNGGTLNRLVDEVAREARFTVPRLRRRPPRVQYQWTWPVRPHVDPLKEAVAEEKGLKNLTLTITDALAARGTSIEVHLKKLQRERDLLEEAGLPVPEHLRGAVEVLELAQQQKETANA